jgi:guanylate kinase
LLSSVAKSIGKENDNLSKRLREVEESTGSSMKFEIDTSFGFYISAATVLNLLAQTLHRNSGEDFIRICNVLAEMAKNMQSVVDHDESIQEKEADEALNQLKGLLNNDDNLFDSTGYEV